MERPQCASASVCVHFAPGEAPHNLHKALTLFGRFGDIARLEMTLVGANSRVHVSFFDARCTEKVVAEFKDRAELCREAAHDFRALSITASVFAQLPATIAGLHTFGEVAQISVCADGDMLVEFYDKRAARQMHLAVPGSRPRAPLAAASLAARGPDCRARFAGGGDAPAPGAARGGGCRARPGSVPPLPTRLGVASLETQGTGCAPAVPPKPKWRAGRPVTPKLDSDARSAFEIVPEDIQAGKDLRTTVMLRQIPKEFRRDQVMMLLATCALEGRYNFLYMPMDRRRRGPYGIAFVNFRCPEDVLQLWLYLQAPSLLSLVGCPGDGQPPPAVSYASLQGQEALLAHFSPSAVARDPDVRMRPLFCPDAWGCADSNLAYAPDDPGLPPSL